MFLAPLFLLGLLTVAIPLVLHLRRSTRVKRITFSTTRFFDEQFIRSSRRARFQDLLLMLLRIALLLLFVLALAQPLLKLPGLAALTGGRRNVAIVLDDSASMNLADSDGTMLERAKQSAISLLEDLSPTRGDRVTVILGGRRDTGPRVLFTEPTTDLAAARGTVEAIQPTDLATDLSSAVFAAGEAFGPAGGAGSREVYVFSDAQASGFASGEGLSAGDGAAIIVVSTRPDRELARQNVSVDAVQYGAPQPMLGVPFAFRALLTNHSNGTRNVTASLVIDGQPVSQKSIEIDAGRSKVVRFVHRFTKAGWFRGHVEIGPSAEAAAANEPDYADADNKRYFTLKVEDTVSLLAINGAPSEVPTRDELFFFELALTVNPEGLGGNAAAVAKSTGPIQVDVAQPAELTAERLKNYPLVVLANVPDLPAASLESLERFVDGGGSVLITLGDRVDANAYNGWIGQNRLHGGLLPGRLTGVVNGAADGTDADAGFIASVADEHPALAGFGDGHFGNLSAVRFTTRYDLEAPPDDVLMRAPDGDALMAEKRFGRGRVLLFAGSLDRDWTNFPMQATFVPWVYRLVGYMAQGGLESAGFVRTGQVVTLPSSASQVESLQVETPDGAIAYPEPSADASGTGTMELAGTERAGVYAVRSAMQKADEPRLLFAANTPSDEAEPRRLDKDGVAALLAPEAAANFDFLVADGTAVDFGQVGRSNYGLWNTLLFLALLVGLFEPWLANKLSRKRAEQVKDALGQRDAIAGTPKPSLTPERTAA